MCKVFAMTNMTKVKVNEKLIKAVRDAVCKHSDRDGFGYAVVDKQHNFGGERTLEPFHYRPFDTYNKKIVKELPFIKMNSNNFGNYNQDAPKSFIAHGRFSTNSVSLRNTHPFVNKNMALIHNGVIQDAGNNVKHLLKTDCDTEILLRYMETEGFKGIEENVSGYYAMMMLDNDGQLHVIRDATANLYISYVGHIQSYMIATTSDIIKSVCKAMKWKFEEPEAINDNTYVIFDGNNIVSHTNFIPVGSFSRTMTAKEQMSLGQSDCYNDKWDEIDAAEDDAPAYRDVVQVDDFMRKNNNVIDIKTIDDEDETILSMSAKDLIKKYGNYGGSKQ